MQVWWTIIIKQSLLYIQPVYSFLVSPRYRCWFHVLGSPPCPQVKVPLFDQELAGGSQINGEELWRKVSRKLENWKDFFVI